MSTEDHKTSTQVLQLDTCGNCDGAAEICAGCGCTLQECGCPSGPDMEECPTCLGDGVVNAETGIPPSIGPGGTR